MRRALVALVFAAWSAIASAVDIVNDGSSDYGPKIQAAIDSLRDGPPWPDESGGEIRLQGRHPVLTPILVSCPNISILGTGGHHSFATTIEWKNTDPAAALFTLIAPLDKSRRSNGFRMSGVKIRGKKAGTAFRFAQRDIYTRGFHFERVSVSKFATVFEFQRGKRRLWGGLRCEGSYFLYNGKILAAVAGALNESSFAGCQMHKNGLASEGWPPRYALDFVGGANLTLSACIVENQPRVLRARNVLNLTMERCRFEGNSLKGETDPVVLIEGCGGVCLRNNFNRLLKNEHGPNLPPTIMLLNCRDYDVGPMLGEIRIRRDWDSRF